MENQFGKFWGAEWASRALSLLISPGEQPGGSVAVAVEAKKLTQSSLRAHLLFGTYHKAQKEKNDQPEQSSCSWHNRRT